MFPNSGFADAVRRARERKKLLKDAEKRLEQTYLIEDHSGYSRKISLKGDRRIQLRVEGALGVIDKVEWHVSVFNIDTEEPHTTEFWYLNGFGKNVDLAKGSSVMFRLEPKILDLRRVRAWASKEADLVFFYLRQPFYTSRDWHPGNPNNPLPH